MTYSQSSLNKIPSNNLSVLMVSTFPPDKDGIASYTARLVKALQNEGLKVKVASNSRDWKRNSPFYIFSIMRKVIKSRVNLVHVQLSYFMFGNEYYTGFFPLLIFLLKIIGKKLVITFHDVVPNSNLTRDFFIQFTAPRFLRLKRWALIYYTRTVCSKVNKVVVHSELARNILTKDYYVPQKRIQVIPHGIDQVSFPLIKSKVKKNHDFVVTYFGLVRNGKGLEDLVKAWQTVEGKINAELRIIGGKHPHLDDNCYDDLVNLVNNFGLKKSIRFCGYVPNEILPNFLASSDIFVFPYKEWGDVIASSGALSVVAPYLKPIIATDVPAFYSLKKRGAAKIIKRGDVSSLASAILEILNNNCIKSLLVDRLKNWLLESSWSRIATKLGILYSEVVDPEIEISSYLSTKKSKNGNS